MVFNVDGEKPEADVNNEYRENSDWSDDEDSSSSDSSSDSDSFFEAMREEVGPIKLPVIKTKGELDIDDLPPIEHLVISVSENEMEKIGKIHAIVEKLVVIRALKEKKPLDIDSVLFLSHDKPLGRVFDVFGPVVEPFYSVRFNTIEDISKKAIEVDADVFFAPEKGDITSYVFVDSLKNQKGSDASWKDNNEPPIECLDYSDDEKERDARKQRNLVKRNNKFNSNSDVPFKRSVQGNSLEESIPSEQAEIHQRVIRKASFRYSTPLSAFSPSPSICSLRNSPTNSFYMPPPQPCPRNTQSGSFQFSRQDVLSSPFHPPSSAPPVFRFGNSSTYMSSLPPSPRNIQGASIQYSSPNYFYRPLPTFSPSPSLFNSGNSSTYISSSPPSPRNIQNRPHPPVSPSDCSVVRPIRVQHSSRGSTPRQPRFPNNFPWTQAPSPSPLHHAAYSQPQFGQMSVLQQMPPALNPPSPFQPQVSSNVPTLIPANMSPVHPQNYFNQTFSRSPSPAVQNGPKSPDPWLPNRAPIPLTNLPPSAPLTVYIPPNISSPMHVLEQNNASMQPFVNRQPFNFSQPSMNQQTVNFANSNVQPRFN